jgi:outer membrane receptor protein involved in Fe transport
VAAGKTELLRLTLDLSKLKSEEHKIYGDRLIETDDGAQVTRIDRAVLDSLANPTGTFEGALGMVPGTDSDQEGVTFHGSSSPESRYSVDGVDTTGLSHGGVGSPMSTEFIDEIEVITGGYMAEHGRSTGGLVNVSTRTGTNEFKGSVFSRFTNSLLQKRNQRAPIQSWIDVESNLAYDLTLGATLGGPVIKDELFFFVGLQPRLIATDTRRITKRRTDCRTTLPDGSQSGCEQDEAGDFMYADGEPDFDDKGFLIYDELDSSTSRSQATEYQFVSKLNYSPTPEHAGQLSISGTPFTRQSLGVTGEPQAVSRDVQVLTTDASLKWVSKLNDARTTIEAVAGLHRSTFSSGSIDEAANAIPQERLVFGDFGTWAAGTNTTNPSQRRESLATIEGCQDSMDKSKDPYQFIDNCPDTGIGYSVGGIGFLQDEEEQRAAGSLSLLQRVKAAGDHQIKVGVDVENNFMNKKRLLSGDVRFTDLQGGINRIEVFRYVALSPDSDGSDRFGDLCGRGGLNADPVACDYTPPGDVRGHTLNLAGYLQDSWQPIPNLTFNAGIRYEEQRLRNAEHLQGTKAVGTGQPLGKNAMTLRNMWAPRIGLLYDWTKEGRSKIYGSWGRYYESIPMDINDRSFGGESWMESHYDSSNSEQCGEYVPNLGGPAGAGCLASGADPANGDILTGAGILVASGLEAQYMDEMIAGLEMEIAEDTKFGLTYQNRSLGRVLEDVSTDNAQTYVLANPGSWSQEEEDKLSARIDNETDAGEKSRLINQLEQFRGIRKFDAPRRDYHAITATLSRRFSRKLFLQSSYTYSKTEGNYQGLLSGTNGQVDPNITSLFDLPELMANRDGPLPQDRPHFFKFDGFYNFDLKRAGELTTGVSLRALSGNPINATGAHYRYGQDETMLLPRGGMGRIEFDLGASLKIGYKRNLGRGMRLEGFIDFFNLNALAGQGTASVDESYTRDNVNPVVGGRYEDLIYLKGLSDTGGAETGAPVLRNRNFGNATSLRSAPAAQLTARLTF